MERIRRGLRLPEGTAAFCAAETGKWQRRLVRERLGVAHDPHRARDVAEAAVRSAAEVMNNPPDLINVALEMLVKASLKFREQVEHLRWVDSLGDTAAWLEGIAEAKIADFAGEAAAADAAVNRTVSPLKRLALLACMVHVARTRARDDLAEMFCKRMAQVTKLAKAELTEIREREAEISERLIINYRGVLACLDRRNPADAAEAVGLARATVEQAGGFEAQLADIEAVSARYANNYMPLVARHHRRDRATMFAFTRVVELGATSADRSVLDAVEHALAHAHLIRDLIPDHRDGVRVDLSFASEQWQRIVLDRDHPGRLTAATSKRASSRISPRSCGPATSRSGGRKRRSAQLLAWEDCEGLLDEFCAETGLPASAHAFTDQLRTTLTEQAAVVDASTPRTPTS